MPLVMNATSQEQQVKVHGAYFTFKPGQIKNMVEEKVFFLTSKAAHLGFVSLPESLEDPEFAGSPEGKKLIEEGRRRGVENRIRHLEWHVDNERNALRKDMDMRNMKSDVSAEMNSESLSALESSIKELALYRKSMKNAEVEKAEKLKDLEKLLGE